jgi:hypothetical protein
VSVRPEVSGRRDDHDTGVPGGFHGLDEGIFFGRRKERTADSEDEDDIFMPSTKAKSTASSKGKSTASSKGKSTASSKGKSAASSKGKSAASTEDDDNAFM